MANLNEDMTDQEIKDWLRARRAAIRNDPARTKAVLEYRAKLIKQIENDGFKLAELFTASEKPSEYKHPHTGEVWTRYSGAKKKPDWVKKLEKGEEIPKEPGKATAH